MTYKEFQFLILLGKMSKKYKKWFYQVQGVKNTQVL